jgi:thymidylate kinase
LSASLEKWLRYKLDVHLIYMGSGDGRAGIVNGLRRHLSKILSGKKGTLKQNASEEPMQSGILEKLYRLFDLLLMRRKLRLLRTSRRLADGGSMVLLDRYPQQQFNAISDGPRQQDGRGFAWAARQEMRLFDEAQRLGPDLVLKLIVSPETAQARKPDHDVETLRRKCAITEALQVKNADTVMLDAGQDPETVVLAAKRAVWAHLGKQDRP